MIFLDTSAFLKLYLRETGSEFVQAQVVAQDHPLPVWNLLNAEFTNALRLKVFWGEIDNDTADRLTTLFDERGSRGQYYAPDIDDDRLMADFRKLCRHTPQTGCRTPDILHVACALQIVPECFISYDERQRELAVTAGLVVLPSALS